MSIEPVQDLLTEGEARRLTQRIALLLDSAAGTLDKLAGSIREARDRRADLALGYSSWAEYAAEEFAPRTAGLAAPIRRELVATLSVEAEGSGALSTRQLGPALGVTPMTISNDRRSTGAGVKDLYTSPDPKDVPYDEDPYVDDVIREWNDEDGEPTPPFDPATGEVLDGEPPAPRMVRGLDDKQYPVPAPTERKPRRQPLPDSFWRATYDLTKKVDSLTRLVEDDRFPQNAEKVATANRSDLIRAIDALQRIADRLPSQN